MTTTQRPTLYLITADEALVLESLDGAHGEPARQIAQLVAEAAITTGADSRETGRRFRAVYQALGIDPPA